MNHFYDANMLLSVRFAGAVGSQRKSLRALWLIVGSKLTDNNRLTATQFRLAVCYRLWINFFTHSPTPPHSLFLQLVGYCYSVIVYFDGNFVV